MAETVQQLLRERAEDDSPGVLYGDRSWTWREHVAEASAEAAAPDRPARHRPPAARRRAAGQHPGHAAVDGRRRAGRLRALRHQHHPPRRRPRCRRTTGRVPGPRHRRRAPAPARRRRPRRRTRPRHVVARVGRPAGGRRRARAAARGRGDGHLHDDLHLGHERGPEGGAGGPPDGAVLGAQPGRPVRDHARRRLLPVDAAVPLQRRRRRLGGRGGRRCRDGAGEVLRLAVPRGRPSPRRDVHELRRPPARLRARDTRAARRRRQPAARRLRQRGRRPRHRRVQPPLRLHGDGRLRLDRARRDHHPRGGHARRDRSARASTAWRSTTPRR